MNKNTKNNSGVKVTTGIKAGGFMSNHSRPLTVKSGLKAGSSDIFKANHNRRLTVKSGLKAGSSDIFKANHNRCLAR